MTAISLRRAMFAGLVLPLALATVAFAQDHNGGPGPDRPGAHATRDPAARMAAHAQHLRDVLQLRPDQEGALTAFMETMKRPEHRMDHMDRGPEGREAMTTPERLDKMQAHMDEMRTRMAAHIDATKRFYAQLSPAQQKAFDALPMHGGGMGRRHMGGPGEHGPGRDGGMHPGGPPPEG